MSLKSFIKYYEGIKSNEVISFKNMETIRKELGCSYQELMDYPATYITNIYNDLVANSLVQNAKAEQNGSRSESKSNA